MELNFLHKLFLCLTAAVLIFFIGFYIGYNNGETTINIETFERSAESTETGLININTATSEELDLLPGIGPALASAIIEYRETNGEFTNTEDIMNVKGISLNVYRNIKTLITV